MAGNRGAIKEILDFLEIEAAHESLLFPEDSNETMTFTAHASVDTFGTWAEIVDNLSVTLSSKFTSDGGHISSLKAESASASDKVYIIELAHGASKIIIARGRIISGTVLLDTIQQIRIRAPLIPAGETIYYRIKCETGGANITASIRYHYDH